MVIDEIRREIASRFGFRVNAHRMDSLEEIVQARSIKNGYSNYLDYMAHVLVDNNQEWHNLIDRLSVKETYFFRSPGQFRFLEDQIIPKWIKEKNFTRNHQHEKPSIRILSAGCSTGEEAYSIAMSLASRLRYLQGWDIHIDAWDISGDAIATGMNGRYLLTPRLKKSIDHMDSSYEDRFFIREENGCEIWLQTIPKVKQLISWSVRNLKTDISFYAERYDVIFCRNVLIYFDYSDQQALVSSLERALALGGYLMLGDAETLHLYSHSLDLVPESSELIYKKNGFNEAKTKTY